MRTTDISPAAELLPFGPHLPWLAPLAGYSDLPFRLLCRELGCAAACTEMVSAKGLVYGSSGTSSLTATCPEDRPLVVQLFGSEPEFLARATGILRDQGHTFFDLNAGCPVRKVVSSGSGAALMADPAKTVALVRAMVAEAGPGRVGVKIRLGWEMKRPTYVELGPALEEAGAAWITLHPRYGRQGFSGRADWVCVARLVDVVSIPVLASGDLFTAKDALACLDQSRATGVMFARGALTDPAIFRRFATVMECGSEDADIPGPAWMVSRLAELSRRFGGEERALLRMRTLAPRMVKGLPGAKLFRRDLTSCDSWESVQNILERIEAARAEEISSYAP
ncbi:MAG: tRNA-dihydrouridine synthase family protein [Deltaproteobacteria bacterium]|nr:tRNA-dihydrouridine synthase family protein [Deltaproteobacteria bacterium]